MKNRMFFGTSILKAFLKDFRKGLGSQNDLNPSKSRNDAKNHTKIDQKLYVVWDFDFGWILKGFGESFLGVPKPKISGLCR